MLRSFFKVTFRNLFRQPVFSVINIVGLAIGLSVFILIMLFVNRELNVDRNVPRYNDVYRIEVGQWCVLPPGYKQVMEGKVPEIEEIVRFLFRSNIPVKSGDRLFTINDVAYVDSNFKKVFPIQYLAGNPNTALSGADQMVISEDLAHTLFGDENPMGKVIRIANQENVKISGVFHKPENTHMVYDALVSMGTYANMRGAKSLENTNASNFPFYLLLSPGADVKSVEDKVYDIYVTQLANTWAEGNIPREELNFRPLGDIYFFKAAQFEGGVRHGNRLVVYSFIGIAIFILLIACFNFINLTTARASKRAREVGLKKVVGAGKQQLVRQFLGESLVVTVIAAVLAITLVQIVLPLYNIMIGGNFAFTDLITPANVAIFVAGILVTTLISGLYPAFYLTAFRPVVSLRGGTGSGKGNGRFRKVLIVTQFVISIILIAGTIAVYYQLNYLRNKPLGFNGEQVIVEVGNRDIKKHFDAYKADLLSYPNINLVTYAHGIPGRVFNTETFRWNKEDITVRCTSTDPDYPDVMGLEMKSGRYFQWDHPTDKYKTCVINETLANMLGWDDPVGKIIHHDTAGSFFSVFPYSGFKIIGVVKDFHIESLHQEIVPMAIGWNYEYLYQVAMKVNARNMPQTLAFLEKTWNKYSPDFPFRYEFLDQKFAQMYHTEEQLGEVMTYFTLLGLLIAALGLFGLSAYMAERRTKEIGIRKVLGASMKTIVLMLSREFAWLVLIANVIAIPLSWYLIDLWLGDFPYRMHPKPQIFIFATLISFLIAFVTVSFQSLKAAARNPVDAVKYE